MKLYTYVSPVSKTENWTGQIDSYFNESFPLKTLQPLIIPLNEKNSEVVDLSNDVDWDVVNAVEEDKEVIKRIKLLSSQPKINKKHWKKILSKNQYLNFCKMWKMMERSFNTMYELIDYNHIRHIIMVYGRCDLKPFEEKDIESYYKLKEEVDEWNRSQTKAMTKYLLSLNAYEDYVKYHSGRSAMFIEIGKTVNKLKEEDKI